MFQGIPLVIGFFDGIHKGHMKLFKGLSKNKFNVLTFTNVPNKNNDFLYSVQKRIDDLNCLLPNNIFLLDLHNHNMLSMSFVYQLLKTIKPSTIIVGQDFRFGKNRHGDILQLRKYFKVSVAQINSKYKTSIIKNMLINGNIEQVNKLLIKPYVITGIVKHGKHLGRKLGYPTANVIFDKNILIPKSGSYLGYTFVDDKKYKSAVFIRNNQLETHIFDFNRNIYDKSISIQLIKYHKPIKKINNFKTLKKVIGYKVKEIKESF
ncbi:MAG: hypothetical protein LBJ97_01345 [Mycoplasmataceae bacterium]|jgi:riboflavin kinase/FMN adenylyltransferase|nr:hypothetical protein [Mycoplasmataceae bacterium]